MTDISEFLARIQAARKRVGITKHSAWYRGHGDTSYKLLPSLLRHKLGLRHERNLMAVFKTRAGELIPPHATSWEVLAMMQHHGAPTRLLDWSESVDVALFFAICDSRAHPALWVLNPYRLNYLASGRNIVYDSSDTLDFDYYVQIRDGRQWPFALPVAISPPWSNARIKRQKGCFTVHGSDARPIEMFEGKFAKKVEIPTQLVKVIRKYFHQKALDHFELFPDLAGLSESLQRQFRLKE